METTNHKNTATILHLSTLTQYVFPFGNFILPIVIWTSYKKNSTFVESHGRNAINFQLSIFLYTVILCLISIPVLMYTIFSHATAKSIIADDGDFFLEHLSSENWVGISLVFVIAILFFFLMKVAEFFLVIYAGVKASNGEEYHYPLCINFIKAPKYVEPTILTPETSSE